MLLCPHDCSKLLWIKTGHGNPDYWDNPDGIWWRTFSPNVIWIVALQQFSFQPDQVKQTNKQTHSIQIQRQTQSGINDAKFMSNKPAIHSIRLTQLLSSSCTESCSCPAPCSSKSCLSRNLALLKSKAEIMAVIYWFFNRSDCYSHTNLVWIQWFLIILL